MWTDIFSMNGSNLSIAIDELIKNLNLLKDQITNDPEILRNLLIELKDFKNQTLVNYQLIIKFLKYQCPEINLFHKEC